MIAASMYGMSSFKPFDNADLCATAHLNMVMAYDKLFRADTVTNCFIQQRLPARSKTYRQSTRDLFMAAICPVQPRKYWKIIKSTAIPFRRGFRYCVVDCTSSWGWFEYGILLYNERDELVKIKHQVRIAT